MAERVAVPPECLVELPAGVSVADASLIEPLAVSVHALRMVAAVPGERVLVVGDNRATDIAGAAAAGLDSLLLADGVHRDELLVEGRLSDDRAKAFLATSGPSPRWVAERLTW